MTGTCQWCRKEFELNSFNKIPQHRNTGDKYRCLGSDAMSVEDNEIFVRDSLASKGVELT